MERLLSFEFRKLLKMKSFYICSLLILVASILSISMVKVGTEVFKAIDMTEITETQDIPDQETGDQATPEPDMEGLPAGEEMPFDLANMPGAQGVGLIEGMLFGSVTVGTYMLNAIDSAEFLLLFAIFAVIYICDDYVRQKTIKNVYSHGYTRTQVFFSKLIVLFIAAIVVFAATYLFNFLLSMAFFPFGDTPFYYEMIPAQLFTVLSNVAFVAFLGFAFKNVAIPLVASILGPQLFSLLLAIFDMAFNDHWRYSLNDFWFGNFLAKTESVSTLASNFWIITIGSIIYIAAFTTLGWLINRKHSL